MQLLFRLKSIVQFVVSSHLGELLLQTASTQTKIIGPLLRTMRDCDGIVFKRHAFGRRTLEFLKSPYLLLFALDTHSDIVGPILGALLLDERQVFELKTRVDWSGPCLFQHAHLLLDAGCPHSGVFRPFAGTIFLDDMFRIIQCGRGARPCQDRHR